MSKPIAPDIALLLPAVANPTLSPDGQRLAYSHSWFDCEVGERRSRIMMLDPAIGQASEFTQGVKDSAPRFSPDGAHLGFLRPDGAGHAQVWVMDTGAGEARQVTALPRGVLDFAWSPDGTRLALCADVDPADAAPASAAAPSEGGTPQVRVVRRIRYRYDALGWRGDRHFHLFVCSLDGGTPTQITDGDWDDLAPVWSPDGSSIAFLSGRGGDRDRRALLEAHVAPVAGGEARLWSQGLTDVGALGWSPDGKSLAAVGSHLPEGMAFWQSWLYVLEPGREPRRLTDDSLRPYLAMPALGRPAEIRWTEGGRILFLGERRGESYLFEADTDREGFRAVAGGGCQSTSLSLAAGPSSAAMLSRLPGRPRRGSPPGPGGGVRQAVDPGQPEVPGAASLGPAGEVQRPPKLAGSGMPAVAAS